MKFSSIAILVTLLFTACSSTKSADQIFRQNRTEDGVTALSVSNFFTKLIKLDSKTSSILDNVQNLKILSVDKSSNASVFRRVKNDLNRLSNSPRYDDLAVISSDGQKLFTQYQESNGRVKNFLLNFNNDDNLILIFAKTDITKAELEKLVEKIGEEKDNIDFD